MEVSLKFILDIIVPNFVVKIKSNIHETILLKVYQIVGP